MVSGWQEAAAQHAEEVSARLRQLLTSGLGLLRTELGVELGLQPQLYPSWVFLAVPAFLALLLLLLLLHCASARGSPTRKAGTPNGRPVELAEEEVIVPVKKESPKQQLDADKKNEKVKKNKKKPKADVKQTQQSPTQEKKESEEGNWETKISNKEKRQQRKRDKGTDSDIPENTPVTESFTLVSSQPANIRKSKGPSEVSAVNGGGWHEKPTKVFSSQVLEEKWAPPATTVSRKKAEPCTWNQDSVDTNGKDWSAPWSERSIFPGIAPWTPVEARIASSEQRPPSFSTIGLNNAVSASVSDPVSQSNASEWEATPNDPIDDEWSGLNGMSSGDPSSDWNAPAEEWGNFGEEEPVPPPQIEEAEQEISKVSDDDKEKEDTTAQTSASSKTKKKKKKKKKQGDESGSPSQETEGTREALDDYKEDSTPSPPPVIIPSIIGKSNELKETLKETRVHTAFTESSVSTKHNISEKSPPPVQKPQEANTAATKQNLVPPPSQAKSEESWESPKQVKKKKKARRET
ncbi:protein LYRIC [Mantella aurantiaca]